MKHAIAVSVSTLGVCLALALAWPEPAAAIGCLDGAQRTCQVAGRPGTQHCVNGRWSRCLLDEPLPTPTRPPPTPTPGSPVAAPAHEVRVVSSPPRINRRIAFADCCRRCDAQFLEALTPTPSGPRAHLDTEPPPLRQTFCGTVESYGVNDELADPRDIVLNLLPLPIAPFPDFVAGFVNTTTTRPKGRIKQDFGHTNCNADACAQHADDVVNKAIHAEVSPDDHFYGQDARFLPIDNRGACQGSVPFMPDDICASELEPERGADVVCVHGVYAIDHGDHDATDHRRLCCAPDLTHDHPEIHPFDAVWWRHPDKNGWMLGVFQDDSNRYSSPHCRGGDNNNGALWSQAPRDVTFRFPFRFSRSVGCKQLQLRHVRTRSLRTGGANTVRPMNVTTADLVGSTQEVLMLVDDGLQFRPLMQVVKEPDSGRETHVVIQGGSSGGDVAGEVILRVAVGTPRRTGAIFDELIGLNPLVLYDANDPGAGYYYAELYLEGSCDPVIGP